MNILSHLLSLFRHDPLDAKLRDLTRQRENRQAIRAEFESGHPFFAGKPSSVSEVVAECERMKADMDKPKRVAPINRKALLRSVAK